MSECKFTAVVLVAGHGSRINAVTAEPKSLLQVGDKRILDRHLEAFKKVGIKDVILVVGFQKQQIIDTAKAHQGELNIQFVANDDYATKGNGISLTMGIEAAQGPVIVFDGDLVYAPAVLARFVESGHESGVIVGEASIDDVEASKALVDENNMVRKTVDKRCFTEAELARYRFVGESFGMLKFSDSHRKALLEESKKFYADESRLLLNWEHLMTQFFLDHDVAAEFEESTDWIEIDTPEDYEAAIGKVDRLG